MTLVYPGGYVRTNYASRKFDVDLTCAVCRRATCGTVWHHIRDKATVCTSCMPDPWVEVVAR